MKKQLVIGLAATLGILGAAVAGEEHHGEKPQMYCIYKEVVKPGMMKQYETAIKHMISEFEQYQIDPEKVHFHTLSGPEIGYVYVMPMENFAGMDQMQANWGEAIEVLGAEKFEALVAPAVEAMESMEVFHALHLSELSYTPEHNRLTPEEAQYVHYGFYYAIHGKEKELEKIAKQFVELYKSKGIDSAWNIYRHVTGTDLPLYVVAHPAKSAADFAANRERIHELLGEEGEKLGAKVGATVRKIEFKEGMLRPDLCYPNPAKATSTE